MTPHELPGQYSGIRFPGGGNRRRPIRLLAHGPQFLEAAFHGLQGREEVTLVLDDVPLGSPGGFAQLEDPLPGYVVLAYHRFEAVLPVSPRRGEGVRLEMNRLRPSRIPPEDVHHIAAAGHGVAQI